MLEIGTSFGEPSNGFSPASQIRSMVLKIQITITVNGIFNQTKQVPIIGFVSAILNNKPIDIYNNGEMCRDFTYVDDLVQGIMLLIDKQPNSSQKKNIIDQDSH